jgi:hypothetical protein
MIDVIRQKKEYFTSGTLGVLAFFYHLNTISAFFVGFIQFNKIFNYLNILDVNGGYWFEVVNYLNTDKLKDTPSWLTEDKDIYAELNYLVSYDTLKINVVGFMDYKTIILGVAMLFIIVLENRKRQEDKLRRRNLLMPHKFYDLKLIRKVMDYSRGIFQNIFFIVLPNIMICNLPTFLVYLQRLFIIKNIYKKLLYSAWVLFLTSQFIFYYYFIQRYIKRKIVDVKSTINVLNEKEITFLHMKLIKLRLSENICLMIRPFIDIVLS